MKKLFISLLITIGTFSYVHSQIKPSFGFKAGLNFIKLQDSELDDATGFHVGGVVHIPIKKYGFMAEALYSKEGGEELEIDYINLPLMATYKIIPGLRLHLGPQFKFKVNTDISLEGINAEIEESIDDDIKDFNFDIVGGLEYKLPAIGIFAQARLVYGIGEIGDEQDGNQGIFQLSVGYRF